MRLPENCSNPSLILRKGLKYSYDPTAGEEENKKNLESAKGPLWDRLLKAVKENPVPDGYREYLELVTSKLGEGMDFEFKQRVVVGLGNVVPTERGISLHHLFGTPIFPGAGIKGVLLREALFQLGLEDLVAQVKTELPFAWAELPAETEEQKEAAWQMQALFGDINGVGRLTVYDALWVPDGKPFLRRNVDTQHNVRYYREEDGAWPDDTDGPNPIQSVTLARGIKMRFWLDAGADDWTQAAYELLRLALHRIGIGAKTSAGYGRGVPNKRATPEGGGSAANVPEEEGELMTLPISREKGPTVRVFGREIAVEGAPPGLKKGEEIVVRVLGWRAFFVKKNG